MSTKSPTQMRCRQLVRTLEVLQALEGRPSTVPELAAAVGEGVTNRTIYRDLEALQAAGFALFSERHEDGAVRWHLLGNGISARRAA